MFSKFIVLRLVNSFLTEKRCSDLHPSAFLSVNPAAADLVEIPDFRESVSAKAQRLQTPHTADAGGWAAT
jgi:hypothetical protein